jgi:phage tail sheath gpL-like
MVSTAVDPTVQARVLGIKIEYQDLRKASIFNLPQRIALLGLGSAGVSYTTDKKIVFSAAEVAQTYGSGSPLHVAALQVFPLNGDGAGAVPVTVYPLAEASGSPVAATGTITPSGAVTTAGTFRLRIGGIESESFGVAVGDDVATIIDSMVTAATATPALPMTATDGTTTLNLEAKAKGEYGNDIVVEVVGPTGTGVTFTVVQPSSGTVDPDLNDALVNIGEVWETAVINCHGATAANLTALSTWSEGRWGALTQKPALVFSGNADTDVATAIAKVTAYKNTRSLILENVNGSPSMPGAIAARAATRVAVQANNNPPVDYAEQLLTGIVGGTDAEQWSLSQRDTAVKGGVATTLVDSSGTARMQDTVTTYAPDDDPLPAYRYAVDIVKLQNLVYNIRIVFSSDRWAGKPIVRDEDVITNPEARKPKNAVTAMYGILDGASQQAIIADLEFAKANTVAEIDSQNPKRLNVATTVKLSGNTNVISVDLNFGFLFG